MAPLVARKLLLPNRRRACQHMATMGPGSASHPKNGTQPTRKHGTQKWVNCPLAHRTQKWHPSVVYTASAKKVAAHPCPPIILEVNAPIHTAMWGKKNNVRFFLRTFRQINNPYGIGKPEAECPRTRGWGHPIASSGPKSRFSKRKTPRICQASHDATERARTNSVELSEFFFKLPRKVSIENAHEKKYKRHFSFTGKKRFPNFDIWTNDAVSLSLDLKSETALSKGKRDWIELL